MDEIAESCPKIMIIGGLVESVKMSFNEQTWVTNPGLDMGKPTIAAHSTKGQIISKANCVFLTSPKTRTKKLKNLTCYYYDISSQIFFVRFFGESMTP